MSDKKHRLTHSQTIGIIWLSVALIIIVGIAIFSGRNTAEPPQNEPTKQSEKEILTLKEDSLYNTRRQQRINTGNSRSIQRGAASIPDSSLYSSNTQAPRRQPLMVELNSADTITLQLLHGIGPAYARRIVNYRARLGGFHSMEQLLEVYGFTPELLAHIAPHLTLDTGAIRRIDINSVELKQLIKHPYIEYYQARDIVTLRNRGTRFRTADDLRAVPSMADSTLDRLLPYIHFDLPDGHR